VGVGLRRLVLAVAVLGTAAALSATVSVAAAASTPNRRVIVQPILRPLHPRATALVIAHRGASAYLPEHTLDAYRLAIRQRADYIEADLVVTADGQLVARHEDQLSWTTDVAQHPDFASRKRTRAIEGVTTTGWFAEDFTLAELKTLRARSRSPLPAGGLEPVGSIPSLQDIIDLADDTPVGLYLELKIPSFLASLHLAPEPILVSTLRANDLPRKDIPVFVESFEAASLQTVHSMLAVPLIQLLSGPVPADLAAVHVYAAGIGVDRAHVPSAEVVERAHAERLEVHVFTFADATVADCRSYLALGVDGVFTDNPDVARDAVSVRGE
jgi:glycerophosphoryl diester phosphodiesterase